MRTIVRVRRVAALGLIMAAGTSFEAGARGQTASAPRLGTLFNGAALRSMPIVSAHRRSVRLTMPRSLNPANSSATDPKPLGGGGIVGGEAARAGSEERNGPIRGDTTGVPEFLLAQAHASVGAAPVTPWGGVAPPMPMTGIGPAMPIVNAPIHYPMPPYQSPYNSTPLSYDPTIRGGFGNFGFVGYGSPGMYGGSGGVYVGSGMSPWASPGFGGGAYRAGNPFPGSAAGPGMGAGGLANPNAPPAGNAGPNGIGGASGDPFDASAASSRPLSREPRSKRVRMSHRPTARKPARRPSRKPKARAQEADPKRPEVNRMQDGVPATPEAKPAAPARSERAKPAARTRSMLGSQ